MINKKLIPLLLVALVGLFGCSNTTVHLHASGLPEEEREIIRLGLENQGFSVKLRDNESPSSGNVVLYARHRGIEDELRSIDEVLEQSGLKAEHSYVTRTNRLGMHEYTPGNIGVYIASGSNQSQSKITSRVRAIFPLTMTDNEFASIDCEQKYLYEFQEDGTLAISQLGIPLEEVEVITFRWQNLSADTFIISDGFEQFEYKKFESYREYSNSHSPHLVEYSMVLEPIDYYRVPFGCKYQSIFLEAF